MVKNLKRIKYKFGNIAGTASGLTSILGSWQVCHNICITLIAILSVFGIVVVGMPLIFLQKIAMPFWIIAAALLVLGLFLAFGLKMCISKKMLLANSGLLIAGVPFNFVQKISPAQWIFGGILIVTSIIWAIADRGIKERSAT